MKLDHFNNFIILVTGILRNQKGDVLLLKRSKNNKTFKGFWQLPEGKMEFGEQSAQTLTRELKEELGCQLINAQPVVVNSVVIVYNGISYHVLRIVLEAKWKGKLTLSPEHESYRWINPEKAIKTLRLVDGTKEIISTLSG